METSQRQLDIEVTFRRQPPDEELVYFVRRCARQLGTQGARGLHVVVERRGRGSLVRVYAPKQYDGANDPLVSERDADVFIAVRNAFGRLDSEPPPDTLCAAAREARGRVLGGASHANAVWIRPEAEAEDERHHCASPDKLPRE